VSAARRNPKEAVSNVPARGTRSAYEAAGIYLNQQLKDKLIKHKQYIDKYGEDLPEIRNWKWSNPT